MNIILAGIMGRYPYAGVGWCSLQYLLGLRALGHRVWYLEDTGECNIDPVANTIATDPSYALGLIAANLAAYGLGDAWCYVDYQGDYHGTDAQAWRRVCAGADLFLDLSGGCWFWRDEYRAIPHRAFIDSDPAFTQLAIAQGVPWYVDFFAGFDALFTFGANVADHTATVPTGDLEWRPTWQPVCLDEWPEATVAPRAVLTTVMTWQIESFRDIGGDKSEEVLKVIDLPARSPVPLEVALSGSPAAWARLGERGWACRDAFEVSRDLGRYRAYIQSSLGEFSVAKHTYVATNSGWFSDRSECYLASGRPVVVQDTGWSAHLPSGEGLFAYRDADQAVAAIEALLADPARHRVAARELARQHFASGVVLPTLVEQATSGVRGPRGGPGVSQGTGIRGAAPA